MIDATAHALSEPTRREILQLVRDEESTVGEIASHFPVTRPAISQHLKVLVDAQLVQVRPEGNRRYYRARPEGMSELRVWLESFWRTSLRNLKVEVERDRWNGLKEQSQRGSLDNG